MQTVVKDVTSEGKVVAQATVQVFDNIDEAIETLTEETCLKYINRSHTIVLMDNARREAIGGSATGARAILSKLKDDPAKLAQVKELLGL